MTVEATTTFSTNQTIDQSILTELEGTFDSYRSRIALLSVEACGTLTSMFAPLGPVAVGGEVIDIDAIEGAAVSAEVLELAGV